jgi:hypothetical protein
MVPVSVSRVQLVTRPNQGAMPLAKTLFYQHFFFLLTFWVAEWMEMGSGIFLCAICTWIACL